MWRPWPTLDRSATGKKKGDEVTGEWRKIHNEELYHLYSSPYISGGKIKKNEMGRACSAYGGQEGRIQGFGRET